MVVVQCSRISVCCLSGRSSNRYVLQVVDWVYFLFLRFFFCFVLNGWGCACINTWWMNCTNLEDCFVDQWLCFPETNGTSGFYRLSIMLVHWKIWVLGCYLSVLTAAAAGWKYQSINYYPLLDQFSLLNTFLLKINTNENPLEYVHLNLFIHQTDFCMGRKPELFCGIDYLLSGGKQLFCFVGCLVR